jgi:hypothetical protein
MPTTATVPPAWLAAFPGTRFDPEWRLLVWAPRGAMNAATLDATLSWLEVVEPSLGTFNRLVDLTHITEVHLRADEIAAVAERRREAYAGEPVTTVFLAGTALAYGMARMYERLLSDTPIRVEVVALLTSAARILNLPADVMLFNMLQTER